ncbi:MAG: replicative DNA helicase [Rubripirellula sp.]
MSDEHGTGTEIPAIEFERQLIGSLAVDARKYAEIDHRLKPSHFRCRYCRDAYRAIGLSIREGRDQPGIFHFEHTREWSNSENPVAAHSSWLIERMEYVANPENVAWLSRKIIDNWILDETRVIAKKVERQAVAAKMHPDQHVDVITSGISDLRSLLDNSGYAKPKLTGDALDQQLTTELAQGNVDAGLKLGIDSIDEMLYRMPNGQVTVVAARPGVGKTAFMTTVVCSAIRRGESPLVFSLEQPAREIYQRMLSQWVHVRYKGVRVSWDTPRMVTARNELKTQPFLIDDCGEAGGYTVEQLAAQAHIHAATRKVTCIFVDYLQLIVPSDRRVPREQQVSHMSAQITRLAKAMDVPVMLLCQLNRESEKSPGAEPKLSWLRESGAIEQDANQVLFLDREHVWNQDASPNAAKCWIKKNRHGRTGVASLHYDENMMQFDDVPSYEFDTADVKTTYFA